MKVDVVVTFYHQEWAWPLVAYGLEANEEWINDVIVVNDEPWPSDNYPWEILKPTLNMTTDLQLLSHEHDDFGAHRSIRQGIEAATTEYVCHIDGDIVLTPGSLGRMLEDAAPEVLLCGLSHDVPKETKVEDLPHPPGARYDTRFNEKFTKMPKRLQKVAMARDLYLVHRREDYFTCGGHDISWPGYGYLDYDVAMRWMMQFGKDSIRYGDGDSYHLGGLKANHKAHPENKRRFEAEYEQFKKWWDEND